MKNITTPYKTIIFVAESLFAMYTTKNLNNKGMKMFAVCNLKCKRNERTVFSNINFSLKQGEGLILNGANASGKTSLLQILSGLLKPFSGSVTWNGKDISKEIEEFKNKIIYSGHKNGIKATLTVEENLIFWGTLLSKKTISKKIIYKALKEYQISHLAETPCHMLSAGQLKKVALCRVFISTVKIWILDEPDNSLDSKNILTLKKVLARHLRLGGIFILATHRNFDIRKTKLIKLG